MHASPTPLEYSSLRVQDAARILGRVFDLSIASTRLVYSDILDQVPGLNFVMGHFGGSFFLLKNRVEGKDGFFRTAEADFDSRWQRIYFDSAPALWTTPQLTCAIEELGTSQVLFGSDYPVLRSWMRDSRKAMDAVGMNAQDRKEVMGQNAARLLRVTI